MKKLKKNYLTLRNWEVETDKMAKAFAKYYFGEDPEEWWVADEVGGVYFINDYFFDVQDMAEFIRNDYSAKKMFEYYDYKLKLAEVKDFTHAPLNIKCWKHLKKNEKDAF